MNILIHLDNDLKSEAIRQTLVTNGHAAVVANEGSLSRGVTPDLLLVDITMLTYTLLTQYPHAKTFLIDDIGMEAEKVCAALGLYHRGGTLHPHAGIHQVWIDNGSVKTLRRDVEAIPRMPPNRKKRSSSTLAKGSSTKQIARP